MSWLNRFQDVFARFRKWFLVVGAVLILFWFAFLDSHSLYSRIQWHREQARLEKENEQLRSEIQRIETMLARPLTDEEIERIAREQFGMTREGEVVYPLEITPEWKN